MREEDREKEGREEGKGGEVWMPLQILEYATDCC